MELTIDATEVTLFGEALELAPQEMHEELSTAIDALLVEGVGYAQEYVPVDTGALKGSIRILEGVSAGIGGGSLSGSYGTDMEYAWQREEGGTITARNAPYLVFFWAAKGVWVTTKSVYQEGSHYMADSFELVQVLADETFDAAIDRALSRFWGL